MHEYLPEKIQSWTGSERLGQLGSYAPLSRMTFWICLSDNPMANSEKISLTSKQKLPQTERYVLDRSRKSLAKQRWTSFLMPSQYSVNWGSPLLRERNHWFLPCRTKFSNYAAESSSLLWYAWPNLGILLMLSLVVGTSWYLPLEADLLSKIDLASPAWSSLSLCMKCQLRTMT